MNPIFELGHRKKVSMKRRKYSGHGARFIDCGSASLSWAQTKGAGIQSARVGLRKLVSVDLGNIAIREKRARHEPANHGGASGRNEEKE